MLKIATIPANPFGENTYILFNEQKQAIIVDAGVYSAAERERLRAFIDKNGLKPILALNTHAHIDHICGVEWVKETFGVPFALHQDDLPILQSAAMYGESLGFQLDSIPTVERSIVDGQVIDFGQNKIRVIHTPGHTAGGVCFYIESEKMLLTGDTLFNESIGRTDLPTGDYDSLMRSIVGKILPLGNDVTFFAGHGGQSTIGHQMQRNPFITEVLSGTHKFKQ